MRIDDAALTLTMSIDLKRYPVGDGSIVFVLSAMVDGTTLLGNMVFIGRDGVAEMLTALPDDDQGEAEL